jgi:transcriptional regulator with XRE-family HTH domain
MHRTSDAIEILHRRYVGHDEERLVSLQEERLNAEVARIIRELREEAGLTQKGLGALIGTNQSVIGRLEDADYQGHSLAMLERIAKALSKGLNAQHPGKSNARKSAHNGEQRSGGGNLSGSLHPMDYRKLYYLEPFLLSEVRDHFLQRGYLNAFEFFCIVIWKANRAKSKVAKKLSDIARCDDLDQCVRAVTKQIAHATTPREKMSVLMERWRFRLPIASAILAVLYPEEFTVYDERVVNILESSGKGRLHKLKNKQKFDNIWKEYEHFKSRVGAAAPAELTLRDKDRYLWGKSVADQLKSDIGAFTRSHRWPKRELIQE